MSSLMLVTLLTFGTAEEKAAEAPKVEGKWLIVYAEEGGKRNNAWEQKVATIRGDTLSYESDGKKRSAKLSFGAHQTVKTMYTNAAGEEKTSQGVYVAGQDYLVLSLGKPAGKSSSSFMLILRRQRGQ